MFCIHCDGLERIQRDYESSCMNGTQDAWQYLKPSRHMACFPLKWLPSFSCLDDVSETAATTTGATCRFQPLVLFLFRPHK